MSSGLVFLGVSGRWRAVVLGCALLFLSISARADLWAFVDEQGVTHLAATQVDARYQLYFKGGDVTRLNLGATQLAPAPGERLGLKPGPEQPAFVLPRRFAQLDGSKSYQAVQKHLQAAAKTHQVDYELLKAVVAAESGFDADAVSPKGAVGLMQLLPSTAQQYGVQADAAGRKNRKGQPVPARTVEEKLTDPQTNINAGARYLAYLIRLFKGELELALAAYNAGEGAVQRAGNKIPNFRETQGYVRTVMGLYGVFKPAPPARAAADAPVGQALIGARLASNRVRVELGAVPAANAPATMPERAPAPADTPAPVLAGG